MEKTGRINIRNCLEGQTKEEYISFICDFIYDDINHFCSVVVKNMFVKMVTLYLSSSTMASPCN